MLTLNVIVQTQMMLNAQVIQIRQLFQKTPKPPQTRFGQVTIEVAWDSREVEDIRRQCIHHFAWIFVSEKAVFKVCAVFAHSRSKTTTRWRFNCFNKKREFLHKHMTIDETWTHHFTQKSNRQSAGWTASSKSSPKQPKTQSSPGKVLAFVFWDAQGILFIDYLEKEKTINSEYYIALLVH